MAIALNGTSQYGTHASGLGLLATDAFWISGWFWLDTVVGSKLLVTVGVNGSANNRRDLLFTSGVGARIEARHTSSTGVTVAAFTPMINAGVWFHVVGAWAANGASREITVNLNPPVTESTASSLTVAPNQVRVGATHTASAFMNGRWAWVGIFAGTPIRENVVTLFRGAHPRTLASLGLLAAWDGYGTSGASEYDWRGNTLSLIASPTAVASPRIWMPSGRSLVVVPSLGGGGGDEFTLTTEIGNYAVDGVDATLALQADRTLSTEVDAHLLTGSVAGVLRDRSLPTIGAAYALTGTASSLLRDRALTLAPGAYATTGVVAGLTKDVSLAAVLLRRSMSSTGLFYLRGGVVPTGSQLQTSMERRFALGLYAKPYAVAYDLVAASGSYGLTEQPATLQPVRSLTAGTGSYAATGVAATLQEKAVYLLTAVPSSYSLAGLPTTLTVRRIFPLTAVSGAYTTAGIAAAFPHDQVLRTVTGTYGVAGLAAVVDNAVGISFLVTESGSYQQTGVAASLRRILQLTTTSSSYQVLGVPAGVGKERTLQGTVGAYLQTGRPATVVVGGQQHVLLALAGAYQLSGTEQAYLRDWILRTLSEAYQLTPADPILNRRYSQVGWDTSLHPSLCGGHSSMSVLVHPHQAGGTLLEEALHPPVSAPRQALSEATHPRSQAASKLPLEKCR